MTDDAMPRNEPGWFGSFTRHQAPGALPNGAPIVKVVSEPGDANPVGTKGVVLGSLLAPTGREEVVYLYFVEWASFPRAAVAVAGWKIAKDES